MRPAGAPQAAAVTRIRIKSPRSHETSRIAGAKLTARVRKEFPLECPNCGGDIRLIALRQSRGRFGKSLRIFGEPLESPVLVLQGRHPLGFLALHATVPRPPALERRLAHLQGLQHRRSTEQPLDPFDEDPRVAAVTTSPVRSRFRRRRECRDVDSGRFWRLSNRASDGSCFRAAERFASMGGAIRIGRWGDSLHPTTAAPIHHL